MRVPDMSKLSGRLSWYDLGTDDPLPKTVADFVTDQVLELYTFGESSASEKLGEIAQSIANKYKSANYLTPKQLVLLIKYLKTSSPKSKADEICEEITRGTSGSPIWSQVVLHGMAGRR